MGQNINRQPHSQDLTIAALGTVSSVLNYGNVVMGVLQPVTAPVSATFLLHGSANFAGPYSAIKDDTNTPIGPISWDGTNHVTIPVEAAKYPYLKVVTNVAETTGLTIKSSTKA